MLRKNTLRFTGGRMKPFHVLILVLGLLTLAACGGGTQTGPLAAPSNLTATPGAAEIVLTWTDNSTAEEGFRIFRKSETDADFPADATAQVGTDVTEYRDAAVSSAESYVYRVRAFSSTAEGDDSTESQPAKPTQGAGKVRLTVIRAGTSQGTTTSNPPGINCINNPSGGTCSLEVNPGTVITLTANPDEAGSPPAIFAGFSGACTTTTQLTCQVTVDTNKDVTATYNPAPPGLTVQVTGNGRVFDKTTADEGGPYISCVNNEGDCAETSYWNVGNRVDLFAEAADGYRFTGWSDNCDLNVPTTAADRCNFTLGTSSVISATFEEIPDAPVVTFQPLNSGTEDLTYRVGTSVTLRWTVQNGPLTSLTLNGAALDVGATSRTFTLPATGGENAYRLEARNANETPGVATKTITTGEVPQIGEPAEQPATSSPAVQPVNGNYTLTYTPQTTSGSITRGNVAAYTYTLTPEEPAGAARSVTLTSAGSGRYVLTLPEATTTPGRYLLTANNEFGSSANTPGTGSDEFTIAAAQVPAPTITGFTAPDTTFAVNGTATFNWTSISNAPTSVSLLIGPDPGTAGPAITPTTLLTTTSVVTAPSTVFRLRASNAGGITTSTEQVPITTGLAPVTTPGPVVTVDVLTGAYTFNWTQPGTTPVTYVLTAPTGSAAVVPAIPVDATTVSISGAVTGEVYTLRATNPFGPSSGVDGTDAAPVPFTIP
jgi:hypothetical protein